MKRIFAWILCAVLLAVPSRAERIPILMYHDISDTGTGDFTVTPTRFEEHLTALESAGYHTVTFGDLIRFVYDDGSLPASPVLLSFDDGYDGVLSHAAEIAGRHGMTLSCAVIGSLCGRNGHFLLTDVPEYVEIVSHTYALHDRPDWDGIVCPDADLLRYEQILTEDSGEMQQTCGEAFPYASAVLVYPHGRWSQESERVLRSLGYAVTVTCETGIADVRRREPESLYALPRISVWQDMTAEELLAAISDKEGS